ncbi:MAG: hypothetical protein FD138_3896 [Planctomycetota bacterium]|nr:MAG: hypothetical protein FD138_3896 [Planctomycetota bacterium]
MRTQCFRFCCGLAVALLASLLINTQADEPASSRNAADVDKRVSELVVRIAGLEERVAKLEAKDGQPNDPRKLKNVEAEPGKQADNPLELVDWKHSFVKGQFQNGYRISVTLKNTAKKRIKLMEAGVAFTDLLDEEIYVIRLQQDVDIDAGASTVISADYPINQFIPKHARLKDLKKEDIKAKFVVGRIVFTDNTILDLTK